MKIERLKTQAAGTWARDCELLYLILSKGLTISYHREEDDTYWKMHFTSVVAYKVISEEFSRTSYLIDLPVDGAFFEITDSPWMDEFRKNKDEILGKCKHYIFKFYDETIEIIAQELMIEQMQTKPNMHDEM